MAPHSLVKNLVDSGNGTALSFIVVAPILWAASGPVPTAVNAWCETVAARSPLLVPGLGAIQYVATTASSVVRSSPSPRSVRMECVCVGGQCPKKSCLWVFKGARNVKMYGSSTGREFGESEGNQINTPGGAFKGCNGDFNHNSNPNSFNYASLATPRPPGTHEDPIGIHDCSQHGIVFRPLFLPPPHQES